MSEQQFIGMLRVKSEEQWLQRVLAALSPLCRVIFVMDDHSMDSTPEIVMSFGNTVYLQSPFPVDVLDESRDKNWLLEMIIRTLPREQLNEASPYWVVCIDGDEELEPLGVEKIRRDTDPRALAYSFKILYLWDSDRQVRTDGVYGNFRRPSMFRLINEGFKFKTTGSKGNLHCSSIPQEFLGHAKMHGRLVAVNLGQQEGDPVPMVFDDTCLLHYGYMLREDRARKFRWYNRVDPGNETEDYYRHIVQGDVVGKDERLKWAGPLVLEPLVLAGMVPVPETVEVGDV